MGSAKKPFSSLLEVAAQFNSKQERTLSKECLANVLQLFSLRTSKEMESRAFFPSDLVLGAEEAVGQEGQQRGEVRRVVFEPLRVASDQQHLHPSASRRHGTSGRRLRPGQDIQLRKRGYGGVADAAVGGEGGQQVQQLRRRRRQAQCVKRPHGAPTARSVYQGRQACACARPRPRPRRRSSRPRGPARARST